jgi:hypothetical protein
VHDQVVEADPLVQPERIAQALQAEAEAEREVVGTRQQEEADGETAVAEIVRLSG